MVSAPKKENKKSCLVLILFTCIVIIVTFFLVLWFLVIKQDGVQPWEKFRLPRSLFPYHYEINLKPNLFPKDKKNIYWFNGSSRVYFVVSKSTDVILLQSKNLTYSDITLKSQDLVLPIKRHWFFLPNDYLVIESDKNLIVGRNYSIETKYYGKLANDLAGFFRSEYTTFNGSKKSIVASHMQATFARETFPCFDEPEYKATFDVSLWHTRSSFALSNMPVNSTEEFDGLNRTKFTTSPKMSTYLLAFVICDFDYVEAFTTLPTQIRTRVYARPEQIRMGNGNFSSRITPTILEFYTELFGTIYPLKKADQIALPEFDVFPAMENWGLITYRENKLLFDASSTSTFSKQEIARVVAHELTHQWFGNLVTPLWWDEIWLNEGFATYVQYLGVDRVEPSWQMKDQFVIMDFHRAMNVDGLVTSRPIVAQNVDTVAKIDALFDAISYAKGACLIRMIRSFAGDEAFKLGLKNYLNDNEYGSVTHQKLFEYWEQAIKNVGGGSNPPRGFTPAMNTWVVQMGFPVVTFARSFKNRNRVAVTQQRFLLDPIADPTQPETEYGYKWVIPLWYTTLKNSSIKLVWLDSELQGIELDVPESDFVIGNYGVFGYYRVNYDEENWRKIIKQLNTNYKVVNVKSRGQIIDDAFSLSRTGLLSYNISLNLTAFLRKDFNYITWKSAVDVFAYLNKMLARSKGYQAYSVYMLDLITPCYNELGWNKYNDHLTLFQQQLAIDFACAFGSETCKAIARGLFHQWMKNHRNKTKAILPNFRDVVYCHGVASGRNENWNFIWNRYKEEKDSLEKSALLKALACTHDSTLIKRLLASTRNGSNVKKQEGPFVLIQLCENDKARDLAWNFIQENWNFVYQSYGTTLFAFKKIIQSCTSSFSTNSELKQLERFVQTNLNRLGSSWKTFEQAIEQTRANIRWKKLYEENLKNWFQTASA